MITTSASFRCWSSSAGCSARNHSRKQVVVNFARPGHAPFQAQACHLEGPKGRTSRVLQSCDSYVHWWQLLQDLCRAGPCSCRCHLRVHNSIRMSCFAARPHLSPFPPYQRSQTAPSRAACRTLAVPGRSPCSTHTWGSWQHLRPQAALPQSAGVSSIQGRV